MYNENLNNVSKVIETEDIAEVNRLIKENYMLIAVTRPDSSRPEVIRFSLGQVPLHINTPD